jgi:hypothetical protein
MRKKLYTQNRTLEFYCDICREWTWGGVWEIHWQTGETLCPNYHRTIGEIVSRRAEGPIPRF